MSAEGGTARESLERRAAHYLVCLDDPALGDADRLSIASTWTRAEVEGLPNCPLRDRLVQLRAIFADAFGELR